MRSLLILLALSLPLSADPRAGLMGQWGTQAQCAGALLVPDGSVRASPFEIRQGWLQHGGLWCRLIWFPTQDRPDGLFASARALCGEDAVRGYRLDMALSAGTLTLIWDEALVNGPLVRCAPGS
jgi:hypothetical protein